MPCAKAATSAAAAASTAAITPSDWSLGVEGTFAVTQLARVERDQVGEGAADVDSEARPAHGGAGYAADAPAGLPCSADGLPHRAAATAARAARRERRLNDQRSSGIVVCLVKRTLHTHVTSAEPA